METTVQNRVTPDEVIAAYKETGVRPTTGMMHVKDLGTTRCCALGVIGLQRGWMNKENGDLTEQAPAVTMPETEYPSLYDVMFHAYGRIYTWGFISGFDGITNIGNVTASEYRENREEFTRGFDDGRAVRQAVIAEFGDVL